LLILKAIYFLLCSFQFILAIKLSGLLLELKENKEFSFRRKSPVPLELGPSF
jgi:hypothetical protein